MVVIIDGDNILHRSFRNEKLKELTTSTGEYTGGIFGFIRTINMFLEKYSQVDKVLVTWDRGRSKFRTELYPDYKGNRVYDSEDNYIDHFRAQKKAMQTIIPRMNMTQIRSEGYEADDLMYHCAMKLKAKGESCIILSDDKDLLQICAYDIPVYRPTKQLVYNRGFFPYPFDPSNFVLYKACKGDDGDNIPGIKGLGDKSIEKLIEIAEADEEGSPATTLERLIEISEGMRLKRHKLLHENADRARQNVDLVDISKVPLDNAVSMLIDNVVSSSSPHGVDEKFLTNKFLTYQFSSFLKSMNNLVEMYKGLR